MKQIRAEAGFTLIELMITVVVLGVLATIAIPSLRTFLVRSQSQQVVSEVLAAIALARAEAVKRSLPVSLVAVNGGERQLQAGWRVFVDPERTGVFSSAADSKTVLLAQQVAYPVDEVVIGRVGTPQMADSREYIHFDALGRSTTLTGAASSNSLTVTIQRGGSDLAKTALCIGWAGRVRTVADKANNESGACG